VRDLARLSLQQPEYLAVHSEAAAPTPLKLRQAYMVVGLGQKMDVLWGFIKSHLTSKTIVFLSTCKQVRWRCYVFVHLCDVLCMWLCSCVRCCLCLRVSV
jgi:ATP-dependent RNA helicase DDX10/DBP4